MVGTAIPRSVNGNRDVVCVTGASGFIGSWLVMRLLERGYVARATVRDPKNLKKVKHLLELPNANTNLTLWKADLNDKGSFDEPIKGCHGVFHVATPMDFDSKDPENEVIKPTINGMLDIMKSCVNSKVKKLVFTSSAGTIDLEEHTKPVYNETNWTDVDFSRRVKMTGWMYFVSKTLAEQSAWKFAETHNLNFISIIPTLVVGPFITPSFPPSLLTALSPILRNESHYHIIQQGHFVHLDDLCMSHIYLYEKNDSYGRYICNSHDASIFQVAGLLRDMYPEYNVPYKFKDFVESDEKVVFSSRKLVCEAGFKFKYSLKDMLVGAVDTCRAKGLLPMSLFTNDNKEDGEGEGDGDRSICVELVK